MKLRVGCVLVVIDSISLSSLCGRTAILGHLWPFPTARTRWAERAFCSQRRRPATEVKVVALVLTTGNRPCLPPGASCRHALAACCDCCSVLEPASPQVERVKRAPSKDSPPRRGLLNPGRPLLVHRHPFFAQPCSLLFVRRPTVRRLQGTRPTGTECGPERSYRKRGPECYRELGWPSGGRI